MSARGPLSLYRALLRAHRTLLGPDVRVVGDAYVQAEFRAHRTADASFVRPFLAQWTRYLERLEASGGAGRPLEPRERDALTPSQRKQLALLERESTRRLRGSDDHRHHHHHHHHHHVHGPGCKH